MWLMMSLEVISPLSTLSASTSGSFFTLKIATRLRQHAAGCVVLWCVVVCCVVLGCGVVGCVVECCSVLWVRTYLLAEMMFFASSRDTLGLATISEERGVISFPYRLLISQIPGVMDSPTLSTLVAG